jgi:uncharacterized membrane protein
VSRAGRAAMALVVAASAGCAWLAHRAMAQGAAPGPGMLVALVPLTVVVVIVARRMRRAAAILFVAGLAGVAAWLGWAGFERHFRDLFFVEHAGMMLALAILFGRTLLPRAEPLCTRFARLVHGTLDRRLEAYTRRLTFTWFAFFATIFGASCALYAAHEMEAWSLLANVLTPLLVALLFVVEYAVRCFALPPESRAGILASVDAFRRHMAGHQAPR